MHSRNFSPNVAIGYITEFSTFTNCWAWEPVGTGGQQPITEEHALTLDPVDTRNILEVDDLGMGTEEVVLHDRLDTIGIDAYSLENAGTLIVKQQRVVIHARHPHGVR